MIQVLSNREERKHEIEPYHENRKKELSERDWELRRKKNKKKIKTESFCKSLYITFESSDLKTRNFL